MIDMENVSSNEEQVKAENMSLLNDYIREMKLQMATINPTLNPINYIELFLTQYLNLPSDYDLEDNEIYVNENISKESHNEMLEFVDIINYLFQSSFGVRLIEPDMKLINSLYQTMVIHLVDNFIYYILGLQKTDSDFDEDLPNYEEVKFNYFKKINPSIESYSRYEQINSYLDYILEEHLYPDLFFEFSLFESEGNVYLANLYTESINNRIVYDNEFFILKLKKIFSSDYIRDIVINKLDALAI